MAERRHHLNLNLNTHQRTNGTTPASTTSKPLSPAGDSLPSQIIPHLFVGDLEQTNRETLNRLNISYILSLGLLPIISTTSTQCSSNTSPNHKAVATTPTGRHNNSNNTSGQVTKNHNHNYQHLNHRYHHQHNKTTSTSPHHQQHNHSSSTSSTTTTTTATTPTATTPTSTQAPQMPSQNSSRDFKIKIRTSEQVVSSKRIAGTCSKPTTSTPTTAISSPLVETPTTTPPTLAAATPSSTTTTTTITTTGGLRNGGLHGDENKVVKLARYIHCKCINIADNSEQILHKFFDEAHQFIDEARRKKSNILVHCLAGISRSPTIAIAYIMRVNSLRLQEAYNLVKQCRPQIDPNLNFMGQLMLYDKTLKQNNGVVNISPSPTTMIIPMNLNETNGKTICNHDPDFSSHNHQSPRKQQHQCQGNGENFAVEMIK